MEFVVFDWGDQRNETGTPECKGASLIVQSKTGKLGPFCGKLDNRTIEVALFESFDENVELVFENTDTGEAKGNYNITVRQLVCSDNEVSTDLCSKKGVLKICEKGWRTFAPQILPHGFVQKSKVQ